MLADGNASFTRALGLELDGAAYGMGLRSRRFALYAEDGVVRQLYLEAPGEFRASSAEAMLAALGG
jgi:peroxiredoxin